jgi:hypothetical protein
VTEEGAPHDSQACGGSPAERASRTSHFVQRK